MNNIEWSDIADKAFNYYFNAIRKGECFDTAADWFDCEVAEQLTAVGLSFVDSWQSEIPCESMQIMAQTLGNRLIGLNDEKGYRVSPDLYGAFHSFFGHIIWVRAETDTEGFTSMFYYWNEVLWSRLALDLDS